MSSDNTAHLPLVSVCIPTYNGAVFLSDALDSVLAQTYPNIEIIVSDDNSEDDTLNILKAYQKKSLFKFEIYHHLPSGIGGNWNNSVRKAKGSLIKFLFQDDILHSNCIEEMVSEYLQHDTVGLVFCRREIIGTGDDTDLRLLDEVQNGLAKILSGQEIIKRPDFYNHPRNKIAEPTAVLIPRNMFDKVGYFNEQLRQSLDYEFWYRVCKGHSLCFINKELVKFRIHQNQTTSLNKTNVLVDRYLIPYIFLSSYFRLIHHRVKIYLMYKFITGIFAYLKSKI